MLLLHLFECHVGGARSECARFHRGLGTSMSNREMQNSHGTFSMATRQHDHFAQEELVAVHVFNIMVVVSAFIFSSVDSIFSNGFAPDGRLLGWGLSHVTGGRGQAGRHCEETKWASY